MRSNVDDLPGMMQLAQELRVQLYLNLATDRTFLFRDGQVSIEARVDGDRIAAAMARVEEGLRERTAASCRATPSWPTCNATSTTSSRATCPARSRS